MPKTGATRHQKFLKSEKSKNKLKGSKKELPKGTNVTKTNFKVKKIVIKEQLKKHSETEQLSTRKLNAKELLSRLNHFNTNSRTDALEGLRELINSYPETLNQNLGQIILGVTPLILNVEKVVRRDTLKVLHLILSNVQIDKVDPFFDIMSTYLRSAMTHIDNRIQEDSLLFLDILLTCTPAKIVNNFHKIVPNFFDMISKLRVDAKPGRTLTMNLNSQITSVKWRIKVIHRLKEFLHKYAEYNVIKNKASHIDISSKKFDPSKPNYFPVFNKHSTAVGNILKITQDIQNLQEEDEGKKFSVYVDTLVALLFDSWLEVAPNTNSDQSMETVINEEAAILLRHVLKLILLIYKIVKHLDGIYPSRNMEKLFIQKNKIQFNQHFLSSFPYVTNIRSKQGKSTETVLEENVTDPKLTAENLEICHLFIILNSNINIKKQLREISSVIRYIEKNFNEKCNENVCDIIMNILQTLFSSEVTGWNKTAVMDALFRKVINIYFNANVSDHFKQQIFALLCKIALNEKLSHLHSGDTYGVWLSSLPDILLGKTLTVQTVDILHNFATKNNSLFNTIMKSKLKNIIENLPNIIISDCVPGINSYHKLLSLFYWIKTWDTDSLNLLEKQVTSNIYKFDKTKYIFDTLRLKTGGIL